MIRGRAVTDTTNPPGQARYLRDVIKKYYDEDRDLVGDLAKALDKPGIPKDHQSGFPKVKVPSPQLETEKRLERLKTALVGYTEELDKWHSGWATTVGDEIRKILEDNA